MGQALSFCPNDITATITSKFGSTPVFSGYRTVRVTRTEALQACFIRVNPQQCTQLKQDRHAQKHVCKKCTQKIHVNYHKLQVKFLHKYCTLRIFRKSTVKRARKTCNLFCNIAAKRFRLLQVA